MVHSISSCPHFNSVKINKKIKHLKGGGGRCAIPPNVPDLGVFDVLDTAKMIKACHVAHK